MEHLRERLLCRVRHDGYVTNKCTRACATQPRAPLDQVVDLTVDFGQASAGDRWGWRSARLGKGGWRGCRSPVPGGVGRLCTPCVLLVARSTDARARTRAIDESRIWILTTGIDGSPTTSPYTTCMWDDAGTWQWCHWLVSVNTGLSPRPSALHTGLVANTNFSSRWSCLTVA